MFHSLLACCVAVTMLGAEPSRKQKADEARRVEVHSTRAEPEKRVEMASADLRLDFDPRISDTSYNFLWIRRPQGGGKAASAPSGGRDRWQRSYNFGVDVRGYNVAGGKVINCVGMNLDLRRDGRVMRVLYPEPLVQYRQFDEKIATPALLRKYPDFSPDEQTKLVRATASVEFRYEIDPRRPSFTIRGRVVKGRIENITYIIDALWVDRQPLPTREHFEGGKEYDIAQPEAAACREAPIEKARYVIFYRGDGEGLPFALLPLEPVRAVICNFYDNWQCLYDFRGASLNQQFVPKDPPVTGCNDTGYLVGPKADGSLPGVRVVFFPELGWRAGGSGLALRSRIVDSLEATYLAPPGAKP